MRSASIISSSAFNSLCEIPLEAFDCPLTLVGTFNSLCEIHIIISLVPALQVEPLLSILFVRFVLRVWFCCEMARLAFNSLCEILGLSQRLEDSTRLDFQFSL